MIYLNIRNYKHTTGQNEKDEVTPTKVTLRQGRLGAP